MKRRACGRLGFNFCSADHGEHHRFIFPNRHIFHHAAPERFIKFRHRVGQLFQFRDETFEFPAANALLPDLRGNTVPLRLGGFVPANRRIICGAVFILVLSDLALVAIISWTSSASAFRRSSSSRSLLSSSSDPLKACCTSRRSAISAFLYSFWNRAGMLEVLLTLMVVKM